LISKFVFTQSLEIYISYCFVIRGSVEHLDHELVWWCGGVVNLHNNLGLNIEPLEERTMISSEFRLRNDVS
jgi:hypothetical protein